MGLEGESFQKEESVNGACAFAARVRIPKELARTIDVSAFEVVATHLSFADPSQSDRVISGEGEESSESVIRAGTHVDWSSSNTAPCLRQHGLDATGGAERKTPTVHGIRPGR